MLTEQEQILLAKNEKMLAIPKAKFIIFYGCLLFGVLTSVLVLITTKLIGGNVSSQNVIATFVGFITGGALYGMFIRKGIERNRNRLIKKRDSIQKP
jgi:hypothetical protein